MKVNMPVTDQEVQMKKGSFLVSRTNLKGVITYVNDAFVAISGFSREELVGSNHNIVRHPDMPAAAFEDMWNMITAGNPWTGLIKNRTKKGDFYWVEANVTPVFNNGKVDEFLSVRYPPKKEKILVTQDFHQKLNAKQVQMRPKGLALILKKIKELKLAHKGWIALSGYLLPSMYLMFQSFEQENYLVLSSVAVLNLIAVLIGISIFRLFGATLESTIGVCYAMSGGYYKNAIDLNRNDQIGDFYRALFSMQVKLNADLAYSNEVGAEAMRIKQALDNVSSNVMVADNSFNIIYLNDSVNKMFKKAESDIQTELPDFKVDQLLGTNIDQFHRNPAHQREIVTNLDDTMSTTLIIGGRNMDFIANPVNNEKGERIGTVVEWTDRTREVKIEHEIEDIVNGVKAGELNARIDMVDKEGFFKKLSEGINELTDVINHVFTDVSKTMGSMANGNLASRIEREYDGVFLECKSNINACMDIITEIVGQINESADFINNSSQEIASGNNNLSQRAEQQASSLQQTAASMEELTSTVKNNADNAQQANQLSSTARELAEKGGEVVNSAVSAMQEINESSNKIAEIIGVIDEIAFQTNLLALNASVEAARAGEQGRGFSVVATEVRNLAQRSATAAKESKELIQTSVLKVRSGTAFVNETGKSLTEIVVGVKKVGDIIAEIAAASSEQSHGIEQVNQAINQMDEITQQNAALAEQASAASVSMSEQSNNMIQTLTFFKLGDQATTGQSEPENQKINTTAQSKAKKTAPPPASRVVQKNNKELNDDNDEWEEF